MNLLTLFVELQAKGFRDVDRSMERTEGKAESTSRAIDKLRANAAKGVEFRARAEETGFAALVKKFAQTRANAARGATFNVEAESEGFGEVRSDIQRTRAQTSRAADFLVRARESGFGQVIGKVVQARAQVSRPADFTIRAREQGFSQTNAAIFQTNSAVDRLDGKSASLRADLRGGDSVRAGLEAISLRADRLDSSQITLSTDIRNGRRVISELQGIEGVASKVDGDRVTVTAQVDGTAQGRAALQGLQSAAAQVDGDDVRLSTNITGTASAISELGALNAAASRVDGRSVRLNVDSSSIGVLGRIGESIAQTAQRIRNFSTISGTLSIPGLLAALGAIPALASAAAAAVGGLASALGQALVGAAGIGGSALAGMAGGFGLLMAAAQPTIAAFSEHEQATNAVKSAQEAARSSSQALADAQRGVSDAARGVKDAQRSAAEGVAQAQQAYKDAQRGVAEAERGVAQATQGVADARREAHQGVAAAQQQYRDAQRGVADAERSLAEATRGVADARREANEGVRTAQQQYAEAQRGVAEAERGVAEAARGVRDARREANEGVRSAQQQYRDALRGVADAERSLKEATQGVADARREAYQGVQDAIRSYQDAVRGVRDAERALEASRRELGSASVDLWHAQQDLNQAMRDEPRNQAYATLDLADARDRASDATREYNQAVREYGANSEEATDADRARRRALLDLQAQEQETAEIRRKGSDELNAARDGVINASEAETEARRGVAESERGLQAARRDAARAYAGISEAEREGARKVADAQAQVAEAQRGVQEAARRANEAQRGVEQARLEGARKIRDAQRGVADAQRGVADAQRRAAQAARAIEQARIEGARKVADAQRQVSDAQRGVQDANRRAAQAAAGIEQARIEGARRVADAQKQVADAQRGVAEAVRRANEAQAGIEKARMEGARQVADAQRALIDAQRQLARAARDNRDAQSELGKALSAVGARLTATQQKLLNAAKRFGRAFNAAFRPANDALNMLGVRILGVAQRTLPILGRTALRTVNGLDRAFSTLLTQWQAPRQLMLFRQGLAAIPRFTRLGVQSAGQLGTALGNIFIAAIPQARRFLEGLNSVTRRFAAWTRSVEGQNALRDFFARSARYAKILLDSFVDLAIGVKQLFGAFDQAGTTNMMLMGFRNLTREFRNFTAAGTEGRARIVGFFRAAQPTMRALWGVVRSLVGEFFRVSNAVLRMRDASGKLVMPAALREMRPALRAIGDLLIASFRNFGPLIGPAIRAIAEFMTIFVANNPVLRGFARAIIGIVQAFNNLDNRFGPVGGALQTLIVSVVSARIAMKALGIGARLLFSPFGRISRVLGITGGAAGKAAGPLTRLKSAFASLKKFLAPVGRAIAGVGQAIMRVGLVNIFKSIVGWVARFVPWLLRLAPAFLALSNPVGWIVTALTLLGTAFVIAWRRSDSFKRIVQGLGRFLAGLAKGAVVLLGKALRGLAGVVVRLARGGFNLARQAVRSFGNLLNWLWKVGEPVRAFLIRAGQAVGRFVARLAVGAIRVFGNALKAIRKAVQPVVAWLGRAAVAVGKFVAKLAWKGLQAYGRWLRFLWNAAKPVVTWLGKAALAVGKFVAKLAWKGLKLYGRWLRFLWNAAKPVVTWLAKAAVAVGKFLAKLVWKGLKQWGRWLKGIWQAAKPVMTWLGKAAVAVGKFLGKLAIKALRNFWRGLKTIWSGAKTLGRWIGDAAKAVGNFTERAIFFALRLKRRWDIFWKKAKFLWDRSLSLITGWIKTKLSQIWNNVKKSAANLYGIWQNFWNKRVKPLWNNSLGALFKNVKQWGINTWQRIKRIAGNLYDIWLNFWNKRVKPLFSNSLGDVFNNVKRWGINTWERFKRIAGNVFDIWRNFWNKRVKPLFDVSLGDVFNRVKRWGINTWQRFKRIAGNIYDIWKRFWNKRIKPLFNLSFEDLWKRAKSWGGNFVGIFKSIVNRVRNWLGALSIALGKVLGALGMDARAENFKARGERLQEPLTFAKGGVITHEVVHQYAKGGVSIGDKGGVGSGKRIVAITNEAGPEGVVPLNKTTPGGMEAMRAAAPKYGFRQVGGARGGAGKTPIHDHIPAYASGGITGGLGGDVNRRGEQKREKGIPSSYRIPKGTNPWGGTSNSSVGVGRTTWNWSPQVESWIREITYHAGKGTAANTYKGHPGGEQNSVDWWGPRGRGQQIPMSAGDRILAYIKKNIPFKYTLWRGKYQSGKPGPDHFNHIHATLGGGGLFGGVMDALGNVYNSVKDFIAQKFKPPEIPSLGLGTFGSGLTDGLRSMVLGGATRWITRQARENLSFGSSGGGGKTVDFKGDWATAKGGSPAVNRGIGKAAAKELGWSSQWGAWEELGNRESGWDRTARNPSSGAYGIPQCMNLNTQILTRQGWKRHDEVQVGDETIGYNPETGKSEWTTVHDVLHPGVAEVMRYGTKRWTVESTPNHRWLVEKLDSYRESESVGEDMVEAQDLRRRHRMVLTREADTESTLNISTQEAALLGWIAGEGWKVRERVTQRKTPDRGRKQHHRPATFHIVQSKPEHIDAISEAVGDGGRIVRRRPYKSRVNGFDGVSVEWRLSAPYARDLCERAGSIDHPRDDAVSLILGMSKEQREAWLDAVIKAEGHVSKPRRPGSSPTTQISQKPGEFADAIILAVYLSGYRPSVYLNEEKNVLTIGITAYGMGVGRKGTHINESVGETEVWCVVTGLGTWTAWQDGNVFLTGNSLPESKLPPEGRSSGGSQAGPQIGWMANYIRGRYNDPRGAIAFHNKNNWYERGGVVPGRGPQPIVAHGGERVLPASLARGFEVLASALNRFSALGRGTALERVVQALTRALGARGLRASRPTRARQHHTPRRTLSQRIRAWNDTPDAQRFRRGVPDELERDAKAAGYSLAEDLTFVRSGFYGRPQRPRVQPRINRLPVNSANVARNIQINAGMSTAALEREIQDLRGALVATLNDNARRSTPIHVTNASDISDGVRENMLDNLRNGTRFARAVEQGQVRVRGAIREAQGPSRKRR